jgi:hypothetical protein
VIRYWISVWRERLKRRRNEDLFVYFVKATRVSLPEAMSIWEKHRDAELVARDAYRGLK